ncbi:MAG: hypothetical protein PHP29_09855, partial [Tissierellia bacterium]|nr:hypothetical protein [Tissierellia bacterium]
IKINRYKVKRHHNKDGKEVAVRSLALATYGEGGKVNRYTLTVPRIIINSENTLLEYGIIKGDVYARFFKRYLTQINLPLI